MPFDPKKSIENIKAEFLYKRGWYFYSGEGSGKWSKGNIHKVSEEEALRIEREEEEMRQ